MGGIILSNYVATYGPECVLDAAISVSGGLDMRFQERFSRAQRLWQPMLTETLRDEFLLHKWGHRLKARLTPEQFLATLRATHVTAIDIAAVVSYNESVNTLKFANRAKSVKVGFSFIIIVIQQQSFYRILRYFIIQTTTAVIPTAACS